MEWYGKYASFLREAIQGAPKAVVDENPALNEIIVTPRPDISEQITILMLLVFFVFILAYVHSLRLRVINLESLLAEMQGRLLEVENQCLMGNGRRSSFL